MSDIQYKTPDGEDCTLLNLIKDEPEWAESRISWMVDEIGKLENLRFNNANEIKDLKRELAAERELH